MRSGRTLKMNGQTIVDLLGRNKEVATITAADIAELKVEIAEMGKAPATVNRKLAALSRMLHVARDNGIIQFVPPFRWNEEEKTKFRYLDDKEEAALLAYWKLAGREDLQQLSTLLIDTGARCYSEMIPAKWEDFGPGFRTVTFWHTKTNRPRTVPLTKRSREIIAERHRLRGDKAGPFTGLNKNNMKGWWEKMRETIGFHDVTPHTLRHTCCTRLVHGGVDIKRVMEWMGHNNVTTTMRYMQIRPTSLEEVLHVLEGPDNGLEAA